MEAVHENGTWACWRRWQWSDHMAGALDGAKGKGYFIPNAKEIKGKVKQWHSSISVGKGLGKNSWGQSRRQKGGKEMVGDRSGGMRADSTAG